MEMEKEVLILNLDDVLPNRFQPRIKFNEQNILELADSIREHGVIQPIVVRKIADKYEIIAGERRYKASVLAGKTTIPAIVTNLDDKNSAEIALIENVQRQDLTPIEEAISYKKILDMGYISQAALAEKLGKTQSTIANKLRLLNLEDEVQEALLEEKISERHARSLLKLNKNDQVQMLNRIMNERMTVRKTDEEINKLLNSNEDNEEDTGIILQSEPTDDIEIIDFDTEKMKNNSNENIADVSSKPIVTEKGEESNIMNSSTIINPGFMDIDKIAQQAQDIFVKPEETSVVDEVQNEPNIVEPKIETNVNPINSSVEVVENPNETIVQSEPKPTVGRFFNMININREENPNYVRDLEEKEVNMDFNQPTIKVPNTFEENPNVLSSLTNQNPKTKTEEEVHKDFILQSDFSNVDTENNQNLEVNNTSEKNIFSPENTYTLNDEVEFTSPTNSPVEMAVPDLQKFNSTVNSEEIQPVIMDSSNQIIESTIDLKTVINTIRDCVKQIESYGYVVDEEEIDLENSYQVSITIDKK